MFFHNLCHILARRGFLLLVVCFSWSLAAQNDFQQLSPSDLGYKKLLKKAREEGMPILGILYSKNEAITSAIFIDEGTDLSLITDSTIVTVVDWVQRPGHPIIRGIQSYQNPIYLIIHPSGVRLSTNQNLTDINQLKGFVRNGHMLAKVYDKMFIAFQEDSKNEQTLRDLIQFFVISNNKKEATDYVERFIEVKEKQMDIDDLQFLFKMAQKCACGSDLKKLLIENEKIVLSFASEDEWYTMRQGYIIDELYNNGMLDPPTVWERFEAELGLKADSLYRLFAIEYFQTLEPNVDILLDEIYDFLYYYPDAPWEKQDALYSLALKHTKEKEDFNILLDLISYQIYKDEDYRKLDFRAFILYKLGYKERALRMIEEIQEMALSEGVYYKSMLYSLAK